MGIDLLFCSLSSAAYEAEAFHASPRRDQQNRVQVIPSEGCCEGERGPTQPPALAAEFAAALKRLFYLETHDQLK